MRHSSQYVDGRFENRSPYRSELARVRKIRDYFGDQVRQPGFEISVLMLEPGSLLLPPRPGMRAIWFAMRAC